MNYGALYAAFVRAYRFVWNDLALGQALVLLDHMGEAGHGCPMMGG